MWRATIKGLLAHKFRLALTAVAVVLGVAFVSGTFVLTDTIAKAFDEVFTSAQEGVDVEVRAEASFVGQSGDEREGIPESLLPIVADVPGVAYAEGSVSGYAQLVDPDGKAIDTGGAPTLGVSWPSREGLSALNVREGRPPRADGEVAVDAATATTYGFRVGDEVTVLFSGPSDRFRIVGIAGFGDADNLAGATLAAFDLATAQRVLESEGRYESILVTAEEGVSAADLRDRVARALPAGVEAQTGEAVATEQADAVKEGLGFFNTFLLAFAAIALFVGAFIIFNTFNILVTQRTKELALLRALGASPRQVTRSVVAEAVVVGVIASAVGFGAGILVAMGLEALLSAFGVDVPSTALQIRPRTALISLAVGLSVTVAASIFPARRASRIPPVAAMRDVESVRPLHARRRSLAGGSVLAAGAVALLIGLFGGTGNDVPLVGLGVALTFIGVAILSPLLSGPLARAIGAPLLAFAKLPGKLGRENAMRNPRRTASTSAALMIGLALVGTFLILASSLKTSVGQAIDRTLKADYVLSPTGSMLAGFTPELAGHIREAPDVETVSRLRYGEWRRPGVAGTSWLSAVDPQTAGEVLSFEMRDGSLAALTDRGVLLADREAEARGLAVGDEVRMEFAATGERTFAVEGIFAETALISDYVVTLGAHEANFTEELDSLVFVKAEPGLSDARARTAIRGIERQFPNVKVQDQAQLREEQENQINALLGMVSALLGLAILIALLGIVNTLALSVLERTREIGLLRAVGMSRRQVRRMVRWESVVIALIGGVLGLVVGVFFGWALVQALADEGVTAFTVPGSQLVLFLVLAGLAGVVAGLLPARRAARLDVLRAITYE